MSTFPLITHPCGDSIFAWRNGQPITAARFLSDVADVSARLPDASHVLNACQDRYRFAVGLAAAAVTKKVCLLPSTQTPETIRQLKQFAPGAVCLTDSDQCAIALPQVRFPANCEAEGAEQAHAGPYTVPRIDSRQVIAYVFTSGSTGVPVPHPKTWGALVKNVQSEARLLGLDDGRHHTLVGTVPPQHMYGFESTVLVVMQSANAMMTGPSFYPADICAAINMAPRPRALVSTPVHMRSLLGAQIALPDVDLLVSATAPLSLELAEELEARTQAPLLEIYGCTETGQLAVRRLARSQEWQLFAGVEFTREGDVMVAFGGHVEQPTPMNDDIELVAKDRFLLHGRKADLINIAGKRNSLANLNLQLNAIPGVVDGAFFMPDESSPGEVTRLTAVVVAPELTPAMLMAALRERIDSLFLPRPLLFVDALPRNTTGKLPRDTLKAFISERLQAEARNAA